MDLVIDGDSKTVQGDFYPFPSKNTIHDTSNTPSASKRALASTTTRIGRISIKQNNFSKVAAANGGIIYESTPNNSLSFTVQSNNFESISAETRGGAFYFSNPNVSISNNSFSEISAGFAGPILYAAGDKLNLTDFAFANNFSSELLNASLFALAPTNLDVKFIPVASNATQTVYVSDEDIPPYNPTFSNLTSYSFATDYYMSFTLIYRGPLGTQTVRDKDPKETGISTSVTLNFANQGVPYVTTECETSTCIARPSNVLLKGKAGDVIKVTATYQSATYTQYQDFYIKVRQCLPGELNQTDSCLLCEKDTYSLNPNDTKCLECPPGATCQGGSIIYVEPGYWRTPINDDNLTLVNCNDSQTRCLGGYLNLSLRNQSFCSKEFDGVRCSQCNIQNNFLPVGDTKCTECASKKELIIAGVLLLIASLALQAIIIISTWRSNMKIYTTTRQSEGAYTLTAGAFMVIVTTFTQILSIISSFQTGYFTEIVGLSINVGNPNKKVLFSMRCLFYAIYNDPFEALKFETYIFVFSPCIKLVGYLIFEILIYFVRGKKKGVENRDLANESAIAIANNSSSRIEHNEIVTRKVPVTENTRDDSQANRRRNIWIRLGAVAVGLIVLEQPGIVGNLCDYLVCTNLDPYDEARYIKSFNTIQCESDSYIRFRNTMIIPALTIWAFIVPAAIYGVLRYNQKKLYRSKEHRLVFGTFYNNYSKKTYYWGVLLIIYKTTIFVFDSVLDMTVGAKALLLMLFAYAYYVLLKAAMPHNHKKLHDADQICTMAIIFTLVILSLRLNTQSETFHRFMDFVVVVLMVFSGGNLLWNLLWVYTKAAREVLIRVRDKILKRKTATTIDLSASQVIVKKNKKADTFGNEPAKIR